MCPLEGPSWAVGATRGCLVTLEGGEGSGKTTQCRLLAQWLADAGIAATVTREPGGTDLGERLRALLLDPTLSEARPEAEMLLFAAARAQAVEQVIEPALMRGDVVICDRFVDSSLAYQGYGMGVSLDFIRSVNDRVTGGLRPDLTLLFDVPRATGAVRRQGAGRAPDRIERRSDAFHQAVRQGYLALAAMEPERFVVIDSTAGIQSVHAQARRSVERLLGTRGNAPPGGVHRDGAAKREGADP